MPNNRYLFDVELATTLGRSDRRSIDGAVAVDRHGSGKLAERVGAKAHTVGDLLARLGPVQRWLFKRLMADADIHSWPAWVPITELAAEYVGGRPTRRQVDSIRHACTRLARAGLVETTQRWIEREEERRGLPWFKGETIVRRRHLCARIPLKLTCRPSAET